MIEADRRPAPPSLTTKRLVLAIPEAQDADRLLAYALRNDAPQRQWSPPTPPDTFSQEATLQRISRMQSEWLAGTDVRFWLRLATEPQGAFMGAISLSGICRGAFRAARVGYHLDHEQERRGYMSEALAAVVRFAFDELCLHRLEANYIPENERSARVLKRAGFEFEGYARKYLYIDGCFRDHVLTALRNPELEDPDYFLPLYFGRR